MNKSKRGKKRQKRKLNKEKRENQINYIDLDKISLEPTESDILSDKFNFIAFISEIFNYKNPVKILLKELKDLYFNSQNLVLF